MPILRELLGSDGKICFYFTPTVSEVSLVTKRILTFLQGPSAHKMGQSPQQLGITNSL